MKPKKRLFRVAALQVLRSPLFYLAVAGACGACFLAVQDYLNQTDLSKGGSAAYFVDLFFGLSMYKKLVTLFAAIPFAASFCSDWNCQYIKPLVLRGGLRRYVWSKVCTCFYSAFAVVFFGMALFTLLLCGFMPLFPADLTNTVRPPFGPLAYGPVPFLYLAAQIAVFSLVTAFYVVTGLAVSAYIPNRFVAVAAPIIASYLLEHLSYFLPVWLNLSVFTHSADVIHRGPALSFAYFFFVLLALSALAGLLFGRQVKRRVRNEVV